MRSYGRRRARAPMRRRGTTRAASCPFRWEVNSWYVVDFRGTGEIIGLILPALRCGAGSTEPEAAARGKRGKFFALVLRIRLVIRLGILDSGRFM